MTGIRQTRSDKNTREASGLTSENHHRVGFPVKIDEKQIRYSCSNLWLISVHVLRLLALSYDHLSRMPVYMYCEL